EFGVVMMLFLIGLELDPSHLWKIRKQIIGVGMSQVLITSAILFTIGLFFGVVWQSALAVALSLAMSSTAIVLQSLKEKGLMNSAAGQHSFSVLLFQDIAVIPILAILPLLVFAAVTTSTASHSIVDGLPGWAQTIAVLAAVSVIILVGRYAIVPLLRLIAGTHLRELFTASSLLIVVAIALLMQQVGLSPALGTFLAGVILANSEFKHELESDLEPFKGLLLGLFFMAVGASIDFQLIMDNPLLIVLLTAGVILIKALILFSIGKVSKLSLDQNLIFSVGLSQIGEFAFVLFAFIGTHNILTTQQTDMMMAVTALSMTITPLLSIGVDKWLLPAISKKYNAGATNRQAAPEIEEKHKVIIVGYGHFGSTIGRFLRANGVEATILDNSSDQVDFLRKMGFKAYYGDATRIEILESAGAAEAHILITAIDSPEINIQLAKTVQLHFPNLEFMVRAKNRMDSYELIDLGVTNIYREHLDTSVRLGVDVLKKLGYRTYTATRSGQNFIKYDEAALHILGKDRHDKNVYISNVLKQVALQEQLLQSDKQQDPTENDHAWDSQEIRETIQEMDNNAFK
ncbi:MAG: cation:proton antiporter, partial [Cytophagales bacterium]|nr:cation:proton antiporter [Cytophaga sp.]